MIIRKLLIALIFLSLTTKAQVSPSVINFFGIIKNSEAIVNWSIAKGQNTCNGLELQWSTDSTGNFQTIYDYSGICGSTTEDQVFRFTHQAPDLHKKNYYRIKLNPATYTKPISVDFSAQYGNYYLYPCPVEAQSKIEFDNPERKPHVVEIIHSKGYIMHHEESVTNNYFYINEAWFNKTDIYFFRIYSHDGSNLIRGKFVVYKQNP